MNETLHERKTVSKVMALGTYYVQDSFKMCNAFLMDVDNIFVLTDQSSDLKQSYVLPRKSKLFASLMKGRMSRRRSFRYDDF